MKHQDYAMTQLVTCLQYVIICLCSFSAYAEGLVEIYELARSNDATYKFTKAGLMVDLEELPQAQSALNPRVDIGADLTYQDIDSGSLDDAYSSGGLNLSLNQAIYQPKLNATVKLAQSKIKKA